MLKVLPLAVVTIVLLILVWVPCLASGNIEAPTGASFSIIATLSLLSLLSSLYTASLVFSLYSKQRQGNEDAEIRIDLPSSEDTVDRQNPIQEVVDTCTLSQREAEVLMLLVQGRNSARISELLYISQSTVKSHIYRIYKKTGVHSLQELIDLMERPA